MRLDETDYSIEWIEDLFGIDPLDDNVDVIVKFATGERYNATFFALRNLVSLMENYRQTGECARGLYVWSKNMIVVERLTKEAVEKAVADLIQTGEFAAAFERSS
jgi:hypothetical protein